MFNSLNHFYSPPYGLKSDLESENLLFLPTFKFNRNHFLCLLIYFNPRSVIEFYFSFKKAENSENQTHFKSQDHHEEPL